MNQPNSLKQYFIRWIAWVIPGYGVSQILRLGSNLILTGLLMPEFFSLMALVSFPFIALQSLFNIGLSPSIIQNKHGDEPNVLNTAWTMQVIHGVALWFFSLLIAWPMATFYEEPQLLWLIPVFGLGIVIYGFHSTSLLTLRRHMEFRKLTIFEVGVQAISLTVMISWAWFNHSIWALVAARLVSEIVGLVWSYRLIPGVRNRFAWDKAAAKSIFTFGKWIWMMTALVFLAEKAENLIWEKLVSSAMLGVYGVAFKLAEALLFLGLIQGFNDAVIFPFLSRQAELPRERLCSKIMQLRWFLLVAGAIFLTLGIGLGDLLVSLLYNETYAQAAWILPILSLGFWPTILIATINPVLFAIGQPRYAAFGQLLQLIFVVIGLPVGFHLGGFVGAVIAVALSALPVYAAITYGSWRERLTLLVQDIRATLLLIGLITVVLIGRFLCGWGLPGMSV
jgi:O-antigen/teichoic acid export membrane protein